MNHLGSLTCMSPLDYIQTFYHKIDNLVCGFRQSISQIQQPLPSYSPLSSHHLRIGGVENVGGSCIISVLLQEWAACPDYFDQLLKFPLEQGLEESHSLFCSRVQLQQHLLHCLTELRLGHLIDKPTIHQLIQLLHEQGCEIKSPTIIKTILHKYFPQLFQTPFTDPRELLLQVLRIFVEVPITKYRIVAVDRDPSISHVQLFTQIVKTHGLVGSILFRVSEDYTVNMKLENFFSIENRHFTLKTLSVCEETRWGKHVVVYRKEEDRWVYCSDNKICFVDTKHLPFKNIYAVVYESQEV